MDHHGVHRKDTVKGLPLRILVLGMSYNARETSLQKRVLAN